MHKGEILLIRLTQIENRAQLATLDQSKQKAHSERSNLATPSPSFALIDHGSLMDHPQYSSYTALIYALISHFVSFLGAELR